jgi:trk system potassium uptake protein TrkA
MEHQSGAAVSVHLIADGQVEAVEFRVDKNTENCGIPLKQIRLRDDVLIVGIIHGPTASVPNGDSKFRVGDSLIVVTGTRGSLKELNDIFSD